MTTYLVTATLLAIYSLASTEKTCYWRSSDQVAVEGFDSGWFECNNTQQSPGGAKFCCLNGAQCGEDSICHTPSSDGGSGWFVGGCTDGSYADPVCRRSCTGDAQTWIVYNNTEGRWHCCGDNGCTGTPTDETFQAVAPSQWSAVPSTATSTASTTRTTPSAGTSSPSSNHEQQYQNASHGLSTGAKVGIGAVSAVAGLAIVAAFVLFILWRRKTNTASRPVESRMSTEDHSTQIQQSSPPWRPQDGADSPSQMASPYGSTKAQAELSEEDAGIRELPSHGK